MSQQVWCGIIAALTIVLLFTKFPKGISATLGALLMVVTGVTDFSTAFGVYSNSTIVTIVSMMMVGAALYETGMAAYLGRILTKVTGTNETKLVIAVSLIGFGMGGFLTPDTLFFMLLPLLYAIADESHIPCTRIFYPFMTASLVGCRLTLVSSTANLNSTNMLIEMGYEGWGFLELLPSAFIQLAIFIPMIILMLRLNIIPNRPVPIDYGSIDEVNIPEKLTPKMLLTGGVMVAAIILMILDIDRLPIAVIAGFAAVIVIFTDCVSFKVAISKVNWNVVLMLSGMTAIAKCIQQTGLFDGAVAVISSNLGESTLGISMAFYAIGAIGTQCMSNSAWVAAVTPIALSFCDTLNIAPKALAGAILLGSTSCMLTPMATTLAAPMIELGHMSMKEFIRCGLCILVTSILSAIIWILLFYM